MKKREHEKKVLGAVLFYMGTTKGETLSVVDVPDSRERRRRAIDYVVRGSSGEYAVEITRLESFEGQILDDRQFSDLLGPVVSRVAGLLPAQDRFVLYVATIAVKGAKKADDVRDALVAWIREKAPTLEAGLNRYCPGNSVREIPPGVPFEVSLSRWRSRQVGLRLGRLEPDRLEDQRRLRVRSALAEKCPKLQEAKGSHRISVLVLESNDLPLANYSLVAQAVREEFMAREDVPDEIYLVETEDDPWAVWTIKSGSRVFPDTPASDPLYVDPITIPPVLG